ncbi:hypothetical protein VTJ04DRAFT_3306 [Mycothermus thermophilus]|uniref:uncharacterized protein n=1 Tax=Humicola insolens TaxID=85995 RepID=UPI003741EC06
MQLNGPGLRIGDRQWIPSIPSSSGPDSSHNTVCSSIANSSINNPRSANCQPRHRLLLRSSPVPGCCVAPLREKSSCATKSPNRPSSYVRSVRSDGRTGPREPPVVPGAHPAGRWGTGATAA